LSPAPRGLQLIGGDPAIAIGIQGIEVVAKTLQFRGYLVQADATIAVAVQPIH
jgi:hypothetical protein